MRRNLGTLSAAAGTVLTVAICRCKEAARRFFAVRATRCLAVLYDQLAAVSGAASIEVPFAPAQCGGLNFLPPVLLHTVDAGATLTPTASRHDRQFPGAGTLTNDGAAAATSHQFGRFLRARSMDGSVRLDHQERRAPWRSGDNTFSGSFTVNDGTVQIIRHGPAFPG